MHFPTRADSACSALGARQGNRLSDGTGASYAYNALNQLTGMTPAGGPSASFTYDQNGNMTQDGSATPQATLSWDESNRLISYDRPTAGSSPAVHADYAYAPDARRLSKSVDGVTTYFLYSEEGLRAEYDAEGQVIRAYAYRPNTLWMTQPLLLHARPLGAPPTEPLTPHPYLVDHLHAPEKHTTLSGTLAWQAQESAFGATTPAPSATVENPLRFSSQYFDPESAHHFNHHRFYSPATGRYISADPIGMEGGTNYFRFANNAPSRNFDVHGLQGESNCSSPPKSELSPPSDLCCAGGEKVTGINAVGAYNAWFAAYTATYLLFIADNLGLNEEDHGKFRHCLWSCLMTITIGEDRARTLGFIHEVCDKDNTKKDAAQDYFNNAVGRCLGRDPNTNCKDACMTALSNGDLR